MIQVFLAFAQKE